MHAALRKAPRSGPGRERVSASAARRLRAAIMATLLMAGCAGAPIPPQAPSASKVVTVQGVSGPVTILVDHHGIPHIAASSEADAAFAMGYMHARDRRFQMELLRMDALGRLRELLGSRVPTAVLRIEIFSRALGFSREAKAVLDSLPPEDQRILDAYADGVNAAAVNEPQPFEFRLLGYTPEPWTASDSLSILEAISFGFCKDWEQELVRLEIIVYQLHHGFSLDHALGIWPPRFDFPPHLIGVKPARDPFAAIPAVAPELAEYLQQGLMAAQRPASVRNPSLMADPLSESLDLQFLSNNWAVSGAWTGTGKAVFAVDPHMPSSLPPLPYIIAVDLDSRTEGSYHVFGAGFPGMPAVPFGTNGSIAWGPTSNWADVTDLFVEKPDPDRPGYYQTEGGDRLFDSREEVFRIRHGKMFTEEKRTVRSTRHGVLVNDFVDRLPRSFPLVALERAPTLSGSSLRSIRLLYRAATVKRSADRAFKVSPQWSGTGSLRIRWGTSGTLPVNLPLRKSSLGTVPVPGWNGKYEWDGFVPADALPGVETYPRRDNCHGQQPGGPTRVHRLSHQLRRGRSVSRGAHPVPSQPRQIRVGADEPDERAADRRAGHELRGAETPGRGRSCPPGRIPGPGGCCSCNGGKNAP